MYGNYKEFMNIRDIIYNDIKELFKKSNEDICPISIMKIEEQKIKKSKTLKNLVCKKKIKEDNDKEEENEKKHIRKVLNTEVTKRMYNFIRENYIICAGTRDGKQFHKKVYGVKNKTVNCDENVIEEVKKFWKMNIIENEIKDYLQNSKSHRGSNMIIGDNKYNNLYFENKFKVIDVFSKLFVSNDVGRRLGPCICTDCSKVIDNIPVFRIFIDLICLRDHSSNMH